MKSKFVKIGIVYIFLKTVFCKTNKQIRCIRCNRFARYHRAAVLGSFEIESHFDVKYKLHKLQKRMTLIAQFILKIKSESLSYLFITVSYISRTKRTEPTI
jgi:hypothetical protein